MNPSKLCLALAPVLFLGLACRSAAEKRLDTLVAQVVEAYGGAGALEKATHFQERGTVVSVMRNGETGTIQRQYSRPDRLKVDITYSGSHEVRVWDGKIGWRQGQVVVGPQLDAMVLQAARLSLPWSLRQRRAELVDRGMVNLDGHELQELELPLGGGLSVTVDLDPARGLIMRSSGKGGPLPSGGQMVFVTGYMDFRKVDGVLVPFREKNFANGFVTGETVLEQVEFLPQPAPGAYQP